MASLPEKRLPAGRRPNSAFFATRVDTFLCAADDGVRGLLASSHGYALAPEHLSVWRLQPPRLRVAIAKSAAPTHVSRWIYLAFDIPRLTWRIDAVLVPASRVVPIGFKAEVQTFAHGDYDLTWNYGFDFKHYHAPSHAAAILSIPCLAESPRGQPRWKTPHADGGHPAFCCSGDELGRAIRLAIEAASAVAGVASAGDHAPIDPVAWGADPYSSAATIIKLARSAYAQHTGHDITRIDTSAVNLAATSDAINSIIADKKFRSRKPVVFVTDAPGACKTPVRLKVATRHGREHQVARPVRLSFRGSLVASASVQRLTPRAIDAVVNVAPAQWLLSPRERMGANVLSGRRGDSVPVAATALRKDHRHPGRSLRQRLRNQAIAPTAAYGINTAWLRHKP